jgi:AmmeMemoRadiSam system protein B
MKRHDVWIRQGEWRKPLAFGVVFLAIAVWLPRATEPLDPPPTEERRTVAPITSLAPASSPVIDTEAFASSDLVERHLERAAARRDVTPCRGARGGIVNHHTLAADLLADFFTELARCRPDARTIIILAPDHFQAASAPIVVGDRDYQSRTTTVSVDQAMKERVRAALPWLTVDPRAFQEEHGVGALVPFAARVWPDVRVLPLLIRGRMEAESLRAWSAAVREEIERTPGTLLIVSADMSHYLDETTALANDEKTKQALGENDRAFFLSANDDFTDNGKGIWVALTALDSPPYEGGVRGGPRWSLRQQSISTRYGGSPGYTTTYLTGFWE